LPNGNPKSVDLSQIIAILSPKMTCGEIEISIGLRWTKKVCKDSFNNNYKISKKPIRFDIIIISKILGGHVSVKIVE